MTSKSETSKNEWQVYECLKQSIPLLIGLFLFLNLFPHVTAVKEICFYLSAILILILSISKKTTFSFDSPSTIPFVLFVLWSLIGILFALDKKNSVHDIYAHLLKYLFFYYILINHFNSRKRLTSLIWIIIISTTIFCSGGLIYFYIIQGHDFTARFAMELTQVQTTLLGIPIIFSILLVLQCILHNSQMRHKIILISCLVVTTVTLLLTQTRGALIAFLFTFPVLLYKSKRLLFISILIFLALISTTPIKNRFTTESLIHANRLGAVAIYFEIIKDHPVFGTGFGMQTYDNQSILNIYRQRVSPKYQNTEFVRYPHNLYLDNAVRLGIIGLVLFLYIIFTFFRMGWNIVHQGRDGFIRNWGLCLLAALCAFLINGISESLLYGPPAIVLYTIFAMMTILWRLNEISEDTSSEQTMTDNSITPSFRVME